MAYFLLKTEPGTYSFDDLLREKETVWDGIGNNLALKNMREMKRGDSCFIYHSGKEKAVVGVARVTRISAADRRQASPDVPGVRIKAIKRLKSPVPLSELKSLKELRDFDLIRLPRLSVMRVPAKVWNLIVKLSEED